MTELKEIRINKYHRDLNDYDEISLECGFENREAHDYWRRYFIIDNPDVYEVVNKLMQYATERMKAEDKKALEAYHINQASEKEV